MIGRIHLALVRYFDPDEFAHLHWTYLISIGQIPYKEIFMYHIPFFQWLLAPAFIFSKTVSSVLFARIIMMAIFSINLLLLFLITGKLSKNTGIALLTTSIYSVFPMILDKTIDVRPDGLMVLFFLAGTLCVLSEKLSSRQKMVSSGLCFGLSLMVFPKIFYALPALLYLIISANRIPQAKKVTTYDLFIFLISLSSPFLLFVLYLFAVNIFDRAIVSFFHFSLAVTAGKIPFPVWYSLSPWPVVYMAQKGPSFPWALNLSFWILSLPGLLLVWKKSRRVFTFALLFLTGGISLLFAFPTPYIQYFLPLAVFISLLSAYVIHKIIFSLKLYLGGYLIVFILLAVSFFQQYKIRASNDNAEQLGVVKDVLSVSRPEESLYDATGSYIFRPDGYIFCCHPYWEFIHLLKAKYPTVRDSLVSNRTKFLVMDRRGYIFWKILEPDLTFLKQNYLPSRYKKIYTLGQQFTCQEGKCHQLNIDNKPVVPTASFIEIIIDEKYLITPDSPVNKVFIDGKEVIGAIYLSSGKHQLSVSTNLKSFRIQLDR